MGSLRLPNNLWVVLCKSMYYLKIIWQPKAAQELLQNLIIAALLELSPCQLPLSCREQFMSRIRVTGIGDESLAYFSLAENTLCPG